MTYMVYLDADLGGSLDYLLYNAYSLHPKLTIGKNPKICGTK